jgi:hypothetical protein
MASPEEEIWNDIEVAKFLEIFLSPDEVVTIKTMLEGEQDPKKKFVILTEAFCNKTSGAQISVVHALLVKVWIKNNPETVQASSRIFDQIKNHG